MQSSEQSKINRNTVPEDFTMGLALFDALPVLFFGLSVLLLGLLLKSVLFFIGAILCFAAGAAKVLWKIIVVLRRKNVWWLFIQMRCLMPIGFIMMIIGALYHRTDPTAADILRSACEFPVSTLLLLGTLCLALMGVFGALMDSTKVRSNWIEQTTNCVGQFAFFLGVLLLTYAADYYHADISAQEALQSSNTVQVIASEDDVLFRPTSGSELGLIFYPGGKVEYTAYAPLLHNLAEKGVTCVAVRMPLQLAFFDTNAADCIMAEYPEISHWYLSGHSLGGVAASVYARKNPEKIEGLILLASYSTKPLSGFDVLSIYGSMDDVLNHDAYEKNRDNLPEGATEFEIPGANHAQFGSYGLQDGDNTATISPVTQLGVTCDTIVQFLSLSNG